MIPLKECHGCRDDFYNGHNPLGVKRCWGAATGKMVTRYRIGWWTQPDQPGAFTKVRVPSCWYSPGNVAHYDKLPSFVKASDVNRARRS